MPLAVNHGGNLRRQFLARQLQTTQGHCNLTEKQKSNVKKWVSRYRRNWDIYVEEVFGIKLYPIQKIKIHLMGISNVYFDISTRGTAKSFLVGLGALCELCTKSYAEIVITSSTIAQASKLVETKIRDEIIKKLSPYLLYLYEHEYLVLTKSTTSEGASYTLENKLNGSKLVVLPCLDSARGSRATFLVYEEARLLKKSLIDSVFEPMAHSRPVKYLLDKKYHTKRWLENARSIYITSSRYKWEWFWREYKKTVTSYYTSNHEVYIPMAEDIFAGIEDGTRTWSDYRKNKKSMSDMDFRMEILNEMVGENENAFFSLKNFIANQTLQNAFNFPTVEDILLERDLKNPIKGSDEIRIVAIDYAFATTTNYNKNDNTVILCMSLHWKKNRFERHVDYIELWEASDSIGANNRSREIFWDYEADYYVPDLRSGGEVLYNRMSMPWDNNQRGSSWNPQGFTVAVDKQLQVLPEAKLEDLRIRTVDDKAIAAVIPIIGTPELNSTMWVELKKQLESNNIKFLQSAEHKQEELIEDGEYFNLTTEELTDKLLPYGNTDALISEAVNLEAIYRDGFVKLKEPRQATKDRIVILSYANFIASKIENIYSKRQSAIENDWDNIEVVW